MPDIVCSVSTCTGTGDWQGKGMKGLMGQGDGGNESMIGFGWVWDWLQWSTLYPSTLLSLDGSHSMLSKVHVHPSRDKNGSDFFQTNF